MSAISALFTFPAIAIIGIVRPSWAVDVAVSAALLIGYAFDSADGQLARLRGGGSYAGEWVDHVLDALKGSSIHIAIAVSWYRFYKLEHAESLLIPLSFSVVSAVFFVALLLADLLRRVDAALNGAPASGAVSLNANEPAPALRSIIVLPNDYGVLCLTLIALSARTPFLVIYSILLAANTAFLVVGSVRWFRELTALRRE